MEYLLTTAEGTAVSHLDIATICDAWEQQRRGGESDSGTGAVAAKPKRRCGPVYCFCRRPAFGEMIGCDDDACLLEWFHYDCVGLRVAPRSGKVGLVVALVLETTTPSPALI